MQDDLDSSFDGSGGVAWETSLTHVGRIILGRLLVDGSSSRVTWFRSDPTDGRDLCGLAGRDEESCLCGLGRSFELGTLFGVFAGVVWNGSRDFFEAEGWIELER